MFVDILGSYLGALMYALIIFYAVKWIINFLTLRKIGKVKLSIYSFVFSIIITGIISDTTNFGIQVLFAHIPILIIIFVIDYRTIVYMKCSQCGENIRKDAKICKHCHSKTINIEA